MRYYHEVRQRGLVVGLALQNGCDLPDALDIEPDAVFIGGTREWKWANVEPITQYFQAHNIWVHVGRVSGPNRIRECLRVGVDSCYGTGWFRNPSREMPKLFYALDGVSDQAKLVF